MHYYYYSLLLALASLGQLSAQLAIPTNGLVGLWNFENGANNSVSVSNPLPNGVEVEDAFTTNRSLPISGNYLQLDGDGDYVDIGNHAFFANLSSGWSAAAWFRADRAPATSSERFAVFETSDGFPISLGLRGEGNNSTNVQVFTDNTSSSNPQIDISVPNTEITEWNHVLITYQNGTPSNALRVYLNGVEIETQDDSFFNEELINTTGGFHIGTFRDANGRWFPGSIDEVALWNRPLTATEAEIFQPVIVTTLTDEDDGSLAQDQGDGLSLREAINHAPSGSLIRFDSTVFAGGRTITLGGSELLIEQDLLIDASNIHGGVTLDADGQSRVLRVRPLGVDSGTSSVTAALHNLTFVGGDPDQFESGGGILADGSGEGNSVQLTLSNCTLTRNSADSSGGGISNNGRLGGDARLTLIACTLYDNSAGINGGGVFSSSSSSGNAELTLTACTLSGNMADSNGGGIYNNSNSNSTANLNLSSCTLCDNSANSGGGIHNLNNGGTTSLTFENNIIAKNSANSGPDLRLVGGTTNTPITATGSNLFSDLDGQGFFNADNAIVSDDPLLSPLGHYGGPTLTRHPLADSPAILTSNVPRTDQRGFDLTGPATIGAVKLGPIIFTNGTIDSMPIAGTLRFALNNSANIEGRVIRFTPTVDGSTITLSSGQLVVPGTANGLFIDASNLPNGVTIDAAQSSRLMEVEPGATVALHGLTLTGGQVGGNDLGGAILADGAGAGNSVQFSLTNCTLFNNSAGCGGAIFGNGTSSGSLDLLLNNCTLSGNSALVGGGGIAISGNTNGNSRTSLKNCTLSDNSSAFSGGGFSSSGTGGNACLTLHNSIVAGNTAGSTGTDIAESNSQTTAIGSNLLSDLSGQNSLTAGDNVIVGAPLLAPLGHYGGPTMTRHPLADSPAIGTDDITRMDQRGFDLTGLATIGAVQLGTVVEVNFQSSNLEVALRNSSNDEGRVIRFNSDSITLTNGPFGADGQLVVPSGANGLFIDASNRPNGVTIDANASETVRRRVMMIEEGATVALQGLTLTGGWTEDGDDNFNGQDGEDGENGGGIFVSSNSILTLNNSTISANQTGSGGNGDGLEGDYDNDPMAGAGGDGGDGGGIFASSNSILTLNTSTVSANQTGGGGPSFLFRDGSYGSGGGIFSSSTLTLNSSTVSNNQTNGGSGSGIQGTGTGTALTLQNSIVAGNIGAGDDVLGVALTEIGSNVLSVNPRLAPLGDYGGPTLTMPPLPGSPALDAGGTANPGGSDQRGLPRFVGSALDIGAVEAQAGEFFPPFPFPVADFANDDDLDGTSNGIEFLLGTDPLTSDSADPRNPSLFFEEGFVTLSFGRNLNLPQGLTLRVMRSTTLAENSFTEVGRYESSDDSFTFSGPDFFSANFIGNEYQFSDNISVPTPKAFYRLEADYTPPN